MGALTPQAVQSLRDIRDALGVTFKIRAMEDGSVMLTCVGVGFRGYRQVR